jgi:ABC-type nickel/cobalt efflux system permease component RcnA
MTPTTPLALLGFGFLLGLRHALDADHLAAVSTMVSARRSVRGASLVGALWGLGHTAALLAVAVVVVALHAEIPPRVATGLELAVAAMLIGLGAQLLWTLARGGRLHHHVHAHGGRLHVHPHVHGAHAGDGHHPAAVGRRPFLIGLVHGLAGSAGLMLVVAATIPSPVLALGYVVVFGVGSIGGMAAMSAALGAPLALAAARFQGAERALRAAAALGSVTVGLVMVWPG